jgi:ParB-like chromosome segregation protein Spo0J
MTVQTWDHGSSQLSAWLTPAQQHIDQDSVVTDSVVTDSVVTVAINSLSVDGSPRMSGENSEHARMLAQMQEQLPPIIVHRTTMRVIDGMHRLRAAKLQGQDHISVKFFSGDEEDAFVLAVKSNIAHGLPLSLAEREAAAKRIVTSHPQWSDRMIASVSGLAAKTVAEIRKRHLGASDGVVSRIGRDGRVRPSNSSAGRMLASKLITGNPDLSLRQVARVAGISPETARDVRNRLRRGEDPLPEQGRNKQTEKGGRPEGRRAELADNGGRTRALGEDRALIIERLRGDPALRFTETGRALIRLLHINLMTRRAWEKIGDNVPPHCSSIVAHLARDCAQTWAEFADRVEQKATSGP